MTTGTETTLSTNPYPASWQEWQDLYARKKDGWKKQVSKYNSVYFDASENVYYKICDAGFNSEITQKLYQHKIFPAEKDCEKKALDIANLLGLNVPQKYSFVSLSEKENWGPSCLATSGLTGTRLDRVIKDETVDIRKKIGIVQAAHTAILPLGFCFNDIDRDVENMYLTSSINENSYTFGHIDFQYAFFHGFGYQEKYVQNLAQLSKRAPHVLPPKQMMEKEFKNLVDKICTHKNSLDKNDYSFMQKNLEYGMAYTMNNLYP